MYCIVAEVQYIENRKIKKSISYKKLWKLLIDKDKTLHCDIGDIVEFIEDDNTENND